MDHKILAISYGDKYFSMSRDLNLWTAKYIGKVTETKAYGPEDIDKVFAKENKEILEEKRGGGYWLWKPYIILKALEKIEYGTYLFYTDAGMVYVHNIHCLINIMERDKQDIFLSTGFAPAKDWCKRDAFILMDCDNKNAADHLLVSGGYVLLRKTDKSLLFIQEWLMYSKDRRILTDCVNMCGLLNYPGFHEHRHDQAILSNLCYLHHIMTYKGLSHVDEPRMHLNARKGNVGSYGYSFDERIRLIRKAHESEGYKKSDYPRIFINTRVKNCSMFLFFLKVMKKILYAIYADMWGFFNDQRILKGDFLDARIT